VLPDFFLLLLLPTSLLPVPPPEARPSLLRPGACLQQSSHVRRHGGRLHDFHADLQRSSHYHHAGSHAAGPHFFAPRADAHAGFQSNFHAIRSPHAFWRSADGISANAVSRLSDELLSDAGLPHAELPDGAAVGSVLLVQPVIALT